MNWLTTFVVGIVASIFGAILLSYNMDGAARKYFPPPKFNESMLPNQKGRVAVITGANVGLGKETAKVLARNGAKVVLGCRSSCDNVVEEIRKTGGDALALRLDLSDSKSIYEFAQAYRKLNLPIHMLILNAGVMMTPEFIPTKDGLEMQLGVNWIGHFYLQQLLQDIVEKSAPSRVVILSSAGHDIFVMSAPSKVVPIQDTPENRANYNPATHYGLSKLMNVLHAQELAERMKKEGKRVEVIAVHPGAVDTELGRYVMDSLKPYLGEKVVQFAKDMFSSLTLDVHSGALTQLWAATSKEVTDKNLSGSYAIPIAHVVPSSKFSKDKELQKAVWEQAEAIIKKFPH